MISQQAHIRLQLFTALLLAISFIGLGLVSPQAVGAQQVALNVLPAILDIPLQPGDSVTQDVIVRNPTETTLPITIDVTGALVNAEPLNQSFENRFNVSNWISVSAQSFILEPGRSQTISITVDSPSRVESGGHYAQLLVRGLVLEQDDVSDINTVIYPEVTIPILISVAGQTETGYTIPNSNIFPRFISRSSEVMTTFVVENNGTIHNLVRPQIVVSQDGDEVSRETLEPAIVLPQTARTFTHNWQWPDQNGVYDVKIELPIVNSDDMVESTSERVYTIPSFRSLIIVAVVTWVSLFLVMYRKNILSALEVLFAKE